MKLVELNQILQKVLTVKMKKATLEGVIDALNLLEEDSLTEEFELNKSDFKYLQKHLYNYSFEYREVGNLYFVKILKGDN